MKGANFKANPLRAEAFGERFREACDRNPNCPPKHQGRYTWIIQRFSEISGETITPETCRKWSVGESQARRDKIRTLAKILEVDPIWLETGHTSIHSHQNGENYIEQPPSSVTVTIRPDTTIVIQNLPHDLSATEAQRIANIIQAYVVR